MGEDKALRSLKHRAAELSNTRFEAHCPCAKTQVLIAAADVGLVSLEPEIHRYAFPLKKLTYHPGLGLSVFIHVERESELEHIIGENRLGWVASSLDPTTIVKRVRHAATNLSARAPVDPMAEGWFRIHPDQASVPGIWTQSL